MQDDTSLLNNLGKQSKQPQTPSASILDLIPWPGKKNVCIRYTCPEFTSLCPVTGQPDFGHITIDYVPDDYLIESKSLKLYMGSFRNHPGFHESTAMRIADDFAYTAQCSWLRIVALWYPRGGIPIDIFYQTGQPDPSIYIPPVNYMPYQGRS